MSDSHRKDRSGTAARAGIGLGAALAVAMSWTAHKAVLWALLHGVLGWLYVLWYLIMRDDWTWL